MRERRLPVVRDPRVPPNLFAIALGIAGLAQAWHAAVPALGAPQAVPNALDALDAVLWLVLVGAYLELLRDAASTGTEAAAVIRRSLESLR
jgi:tellurite resistance protein